MTQLRFNVKLAQYPRDADYPHVNVACIHEIKIDHYTSAFISARVCKPKSTPIERRNLKPCAFLCYINLRRCFNKRATPDFSLSLKSDKKTKLLCIYFHCNDLSYLASSGKHDEHTRWPHSSNCTGYRRTLSQIGHLYFFSNGNTNKLRSIFSCKLRAGLPRLLLRDEALPVGL